MASQPAPDDGTPGTAPYTGPADPPGLRLQLLDGFALEQDGRPLRVPHSVRRLLAFLGVRGRCGRPEIAGTLWSDVPDPKAQGRLRTVLWRMHRLADRPLVTGVDALVLSAGVAVDLRAFVATARQALREDDRTPAAVPLATLTVLGELLPGWRDDWVVFERERLRQLQMHALEAMAMRLIAAKRYADAIESAMAAVRLEPLRESATRALISAYLAENNVVEAARHFASFRERLGGELGLAPTPDLEHLVHSGLGGHG